MLFQTRARLRRFVSIVKVRHSVVLYTRQSILALVFSYLARCPIGELLPSQITGQTSADAIAFALVSEFRVTAVERDEETCKAFHYNLDQYSLETYPRRLLSEYLRQRILDI